MSVAGYTLHLALWFWEMLFPSSHISNDKFKPPFKIYNSGCHRDFRRASRTRAEFSRKLQNVWVCIRAPRIFCLWRFPALRATTIFLCFLDVGNIDFQRSRGPSKKERYHLAGLLLPLTIPGCIWFCAGKEFLLAFFQSVRLARGEEILRVKDFCKKLFASGSWSLLHFISYNQAMFQMVPFRLNMSQKDLKQNIVCNFFCKLWDK